MTWPSRPAQHESIIPQLANNYHKHKYPPSSTVPMIAPATSLFSVKAIADAADCWVKAKLDQSVIVGGVIGIVTSNQVLYLQSVGEIAHGVDSLINATTPETKTTDPNVSSSAAGPVSTPDQTIHASADTKASSNTTVHSHGSSGTAPSPKPTTTNPNTNLVNERTKFELGSLAKVTTTLMIGKLVDDGLVDWHDPVVKHVPDFRFDSDSFQYVTIQHFLTMRSGLGAYQGDLLALDGLATTGRDIVRMLRHVRPRFEPDTHYAYNNVGFAVVGEVIKRVSGMPWQDFLRIHITEPLGMDDTLPTISCCESDANVAQGHYFGHDDVHPGTQHTDNMDGNVLVPATSTSSDTLVGPFDPRQSAAAVVPTMDGGALCGSTLCSSGRDLVKLAQLLLNRGCVGDTVIIRNPKVIEHMLTPDGVVDHQFMNVARSGGLDVLFASPEDVVQVGPGAGFDLVTTLFGKPYVDKSGSSHCHCSKLVLLPDINVAIFSIINTQATVPSSVRNLQRQLMRSLVGIVRGVPQDELARSFSRLQWFVNNQTFVNPEFRYHTNWLNVYAHFAVPQPTSSIDDILPRLLGTYQAQTLPCRLAILWTAGSINHLRISCGALSGKLQFIRLFERSSGSWQEGGRDLAHFRKLVFRVIPDQQSVPRFVHVRVRIERGASEVQVMLVGELFDPVVRSRL